METPRDAASLLRAIGRTDAVNYAFQVRNHLKTGHREVKEAAAFAAARLDLDRELGGTDRGPTIASIPFESVIAAAATEKGDAKWGERLFQRQGCVACHTVAPGQAPEGPVVARHRRPVQACRADRIDLEAERQDCSGLRAAKDRHRRRPDL